MVACLCFSEVIKVSGVKCELLSVDPSKPNNGIKSVNESITSKCDECVENIDLPNEERHNNTTMVESNVKNEIKIFENEEFGEMRTVVVENEPWFCLRDLCKALELTAKGVKQRLTDEVISNYPIKDSLGRTQSALFVNEDGLYDVVLESRKENAKKFRKWVTSEVLPSIRKHGAYTTQELQ